MQTQYTTERLVLKILNSNHSQEVLNFLMENKEFFEPFEPSKASNFYTPAYQRALLAYEYRSAQNEKGIRFWVYKKDSPEEIIGTVSFHNIQKGILQSCQIGYKFHNKYQRQGYATEALHKGIEIIFQELELHRIEAYIMPSNTASIHFIKSLGFLYEGRASKNIKIQNLWEDHEQFSLINPYR